MNLLELSQTIREVRIKQKMTVEQLANLSGFSKGFISQVENFRITPSIKSLVKIADALGVGVSSLFDSDAKVKQFSYGNLSEGRPLERDGNKNFGIQYLALAYQQIGRKMDPFILEYTPAQPREFMSHDSEEFFVVLEGEIEYQIYDEKNSKILKAGDTVYMKANIPHRAVLIEGCDYVKALIIYSESEQ